LNAVPEATHEYVALEPAHLVSLQHPGCAFLRAESNERALHSNLVTDLLALFLVLMSELDNITEKLITLLVNLLAIFL
jgi:hypothetical protein